MNRLKIDYEKLPKDYKCEDCVKGGMSRLKFENSDFVAKGVGELTNADLLISPALSIGNSKYYALCLKDDLYSKSILHSRGLLHKRSPHLVRRLIEGVFNEEAILKSTLTGIPPRAQAKNRQKQIVYCRNPQAKDAIIETVNQVGKKKN